MSQPLFDILRKVTTATITTMLLKKGIRRCWMNGPKPLTPKGERLVGPAFTLRFIPVREDLATPESWASPISTRAAIEAMPDGVIAVADAIGFDAANGSSLQAWACCDSEIVVGAERDLRSALHREIRARETIRHHRFVRRFPSKPLRHFYIFTHAMLRFFTTAFPKQTST